MSLDDFAAMTRRVIASEGFDDYQPTACYPERRVLKCLAGLPPDVEPEVPVMEWAHGAAVRGEPFLVAFKITASAFRVIRVVGGKKTTKDYSAG